MRVTFTIGYIPKDWSPEGPDEHRIVCGQGIDEVPEGYFEWDEQTRSLRGFGFGANNTRTITEGLDSNTSPAWAWMEEASAKLAEGATSASASSFVTCWTASVEGLDELPSGVQFADAEFGEFSNENLQFNGRFYFRIMTEDEASEEVAVEDVYIISES